jgi:hypothetical protein
VPYTNSVSLLIIGGLPQYPVVTARLLDVYTEVGGPGPVQHEDEFDSTTFQSSPNQVSFSMVRGPGGLLPTREAALIMDIATGPQDGPIFRSGVFPSLPLGAPADPEGFIDIVLDDMRNVTQATIDASLPSTPFTTTAADGSGATISSLSAMVGSGSIAVSVSGTATHPNLAAPQPFSYSVAMSMAPETSVRDLTSSLVVSAPPGTLTFTSGGGVAGAIQTAVLSLLSRWIEEGLRPVLLGAVSTAVNTAAITAAATSLGVGTPPGSPPALPAGVILSFRRVVVGTIGGVTGIHVWAALGSFGSLRSKFPTRPSGGGGGGTCPILVLALSVPGVELPLLRAVRDDVLARSSMGRLIVSLYYRGSPFMLRLLLARPGLTAPAGGLLRLLQPLLRWLLRGRHISPRRRGLLPP